MGQIERYTDYYTKTKKPLILKESRVPRWRLPESNWGHTDFQSVALPAELRRHIKPTKIATLTENVKKNVTLWSKKSPFSCFLFS